MARARRPGPAWVPIGLEVSDADAARIDQVLARPEFAGWTRAEWCLAIIQTALRYYVGDGPEPGPGQPDPGRARAPGRPDPGRARARLRPDPGRARAPVQPDPGPAGAPVQPTPPEPPPEPELTGPELTGADLTGPDLTGPELTEPVCPHPADARDYETGTCATCGAILWD